MPEGISEYAVALTPEHLLDRHLDSCAGLAGTVCSGIHVVELEEQEDRAAADGRRGQCGLDCARPTSVLPGREDPMTLRQ